MLEVKCSGRSREAKSPATWTHSIPWSNQIKVSDTWFGLHPPGPRWHLILFFKSSTCIVWTRVAKLTIHSKINWTFVGIMCQKIINQISIWTLNLMVTMRHSARGSYFEHWDVHTTRKVVMYTGYTSSGTGCEGWCMRSKHQPFACSASHVQMWCACGHVSVIDFAYIESDQA